MNAESWYDVSVRSGVVAVAGLEHSSPVDPDRSLVLRNPDASRATSAAGDMSGSTVAQPHSKKPGRCSSHLPGRSSKEIAQ
jgi:hypothetical protein